MRQVGLIATGFVQNGVFIVTDTNLNEGYGEGRKDNDGALEFGLEQTAAI